MAGPVSASHDPRRDAAPDNTELQAQISPTEIDPTTATATPVEASGEWARAVAVSTSSQIAAKLIHGALNVVSSVALIRYMTPASYGDYVLVLTVSALIGLLPDFALNRLAVREIERDEDSEGRVIGTIIATRLALAAIAFGLVQSVLLAMGEPAEIHAAGAVLSLLFFGEALLTIAVVFHVRLQQQHEAFVRTIGEAAETALILWLISRKATLVQIVSAPVIGAGIAVVLALAIFRRRYRVRVRFDRSLVRYLAREALPIGSASIIGVIMLKVDSFMLAILRPPEELGIYGAAYQPIEYLMLTLAVPTLVLYPLLVRYWRGDQARFRQLHRSGAEAMVATLFIFPIVTAAIAPELVTFVYGLDFVESSEPMQILTLNLVPFAIAAWNMLVLIGVDKQMVPFKYTTVMLAVGVALNWVLIPPFGYMGAAIATLISTSALAIWSTHACSRHAETRLDSARLLRIAIAASLVYSMSLIVEGRLDSRGTTLMIAVLYPFALWGMRITSPRSMVAVLRAIRSKPSEPKSVA